MAKVVGDIAIQVGADIGPLVRDLGKGKTAVSGFGNKVDGLSGSFKGAAIAGAAVATAVIAAGTAVAALTKRSLDNIDALSKQARVAGVSVSSFQAMSLVAEEAGVESSKLSTVIVKMQKNIVELGRGTLAQKQAFAQLGLSTNDLLGLKADEQFKKIAEALSGIEDPTIKTATALDVFGKSGADVINMLDGYGGAVENAAKFQRDLGISVSDFDAAQVERANDAMGRLGMAMDGLGNALAVTFAPAIASAAEGLTSFITSLDNANTRLERMLGSAERAKSILGDDLFNKLTVDIDTVEASAGVIDRLSLSYEDLARTVHATAEAVSNEAPTLLDIGADDLAIQLVDVGAKMDQVTADFNAGKIGADEMRKQLVDATTEAQALLEEASKINGVDLSSAIGQVGLLTEGLAFAAGVAETLRAAIPGAASGGKFYGDSITGKRADGTPAPSRLAPGSSIRPQHAPNDPDFGLPSVSGGGGGGGGGDDLQAKLDKMRADFASEYQLLEEQYSSKLDQIKEFRDAKLVTEQEYNDLEREIALEHQDALAKIDRDAMQAKLSAVSGAFGDLSSLMSTSNKKLFKIGQAAAIAQATVDGYSAAVSAWQKGMKIGGPGMAAAFTAASLARTGALIAGIASQSASGGGGGGASAGGGATAQAATPQKSAEFNVQLVGGDQYGSKQIRDLIGSINKAIEDGAVLKGIRFV